MIINESTQHIDTGSNWFFQKINNKKTLLIAAGDSWTWGDSLGNTNSATESDDFEYRTQHCYGYLLATKLDCDYINVSRPGASNVEIYDKLQNVLGKVLNNYESIVVVFTLTELGREMVFDPLWISEEMKSATNFDDFLKEYEHSMFRSFESHLVEKYKNVKFLFARNFTYSYKQNIDSIKSNHCNKTWIDILVEHSKDKDYPKDLRFLSQMSTIPIIKTLKQNKMHNLFKLDFMEHLYKSELAISWLHYSELNSNVATRHPSTLGHKLWADYLLTQI